MNRRLQPTRHAHALRVVVRKKKWRHLHSGNSKWKRPAWEISPVKRCGYVVDIGHSLDTLHLIFTLLSRLLSKSHYNPIKVPLICVFSSLLSGGDVINVQAYGNGIP